MAGLIKRWMMEKEDLIHPDFPELITREEMFRDFDLEYKEWCEKQEFLNNNLYASQMYCNSMKSGILCEDANCEQCKEYLKLKENE